MMTNPSFQSFLHRFYQTPKGQSLFRQEKPLIDHALAHVFGLYLVQLGQVSTDSLLENSRVNCKVLLDDHALPEASGLRIQADMDYLPIRNDAVDVFVLPHSLESVTDPYHLLRQVDSALVPEGHVLITGFNPLGCRTMRNRFGEHRRHFKAANLIRAHRVVDWLSLLGYDIEQVTYSSISCLTRQDAEQGTWRWVEGLEKHWAHGIGFWKCVLHFSQKTHCLADAGWSELAAFQLANRRERRSGRRFESRQPTSSNG